jgi:cytochrome c oxidase assembly protein subunit 15
VNKALALYTKIVAFSVFVLIYIGSLVTTTGSGLSVPDWPLSYGMVFPPMVGGVLFEHGHRLAASFVGVLVVVQAIWIHMADPRRWARRLGYAAVLVVILQGVLGGVTVLLQLPVLVSAAHAVLAQTFFVLCVGIAYSQSREMTTSLGLLSSEGQPRFRRFYGALWVLVSLIYIQLIAGAVMRHMGAGLAIVDFPSNAGQWLPGVTPTFLEKVNLFRGLYQMVPVSMAQLHIHLLHRYLGYGVVLVIGVVWVFYRPAYLAFSKLRITMAMLLGLVVLQIGLAALTVWSQKEVVFTGLHVVNGAAILALSCLQLFRAYRLLRSR